MIVTCQNCDTSFQLDESRVPAQGIRVRCSRCKEAFFLAKPSASPDQAIHGIAAEAARSVSSSSPTVTQDLGAPTKAPTKTPAAPPAARAGARQAEDDEEHDWEFNVDPPARGAAKQAKPARAANGDIDWEEEDAGGSGLSLEGEDESAESSESTETSAFGSVDDFSSLMEADGDQVAAEASAATQVGAIDRSAARAPKAGKAAAGRADELDDPENWDFFGEQPAAMADPATGSVLGRIALASVPAAQAAKSAAAQFDSKWDDDPYDDVSTSAGTGAIERSILWVGQAIGWATTALLASVVLVSGFWTTAQSFVTTPQLIQVGSFEAREMTGRWIDTARGETLLQVTGKLSHQGAAARALGGLLEVALLDADGRPLRVDAQPAGVVFPVGELRELTPAALRIVNDRAAFSLAHQQIEASQPLDFQAIFRDVPTNAARFALTIADRPVPARGPIDSPADPVTVEGPTALEPGDSVEGEVPPPAVPTEVPTTAPTTVPTTVPTTTLPDELTWGE